MQVLMGYVQTYDDKRSNTTRTREENSSADDIEDFVHETLTALSMRDGIYRPDIRFACIIHMKYIEGLKDDWSAQALSSMDEKYGDHSTARSLQIYRALRPPIRR